MFLTAAGVRLIMCMENLTNNIVLDAESTHVSDYPAAEMGFSDTEI